MRPLERRHYNDFQMGIEDMDRKKILGIPADHTLEKTSSRSKGSLLQTDIDEFVERDAAGAVVARHIFTTHTDIKQPFETTHSFVSYDVEGRPLCQNTTFDPTRY